MLRFSGDQLSLIQAGLAPPSPALVPPPQFVPAPPAAAPPPPSSGPGARRPAPPEPPPRTHTQLPLAPLLTSYLGLAGAGLWLHAGGTHPPWAPALASPWLGLTVALHALAVPHSPAAQALGLLFALLHPAAAAAAEGGVLAAALALAAFLTLSVPPRCGRRAFAHLGLGLVLIGAGLSALLGGGGTPGGRSLHGLVLTGLAVQAVVAASRLRGWALRAEVRDRQEPPPRAPPVPAIGIGL